jgi:hypothetical protein
MKFTYLNNFKLSVPTCLKQIESIKILSHLLSGLIQIREIT